MKNPVFFFTIALSFLWVTPSPGQNLEPLHISREEGPNGGLVVSHHAVWLYHAGDRPDGAWLDLDDRRWESILDTSFDSDFIPESGWPGIGWFRLHFTIDSTLVNVPLALYFDFKGAVEVYLNGERIDTYGRVGPTGDEEYSVIHEWPNPKYTPVILHDDAIPYVLAIRHSNFIAAPFQSIGSLLGGFGITFSYPDHLVPALVDQTRRESAIQFAFTCFPVAFALVFGLLYAFNPRERQYLYFALLALSVAGQTFVDLQLDLISDTEEYRQWRRILTFFSISIVFMLLHMVYNLYYDALPRLYYFLIGGTVLLGVISMAFPFTMFRIMVVMGAIVFIEILRLVIRAIHQKHAGAWLLGIGILAFIIGMLYDLVLDLDLMEEIRGIRNGYNIGFLAMLIAMATFLGRRFARTNQNLSDRIVEVEHLSEKTLLQEREVQQKEMDRLRLEAENERKQMALDKAKALEASYKALEEAHENLKNTQDQLVHAEKMASLGKLTAGIAHEIKNPLNFVNNFASVSVELAEELEDALASGEDAEDLLKDLKENASKIAEHGERADRIVQSMMQHASGNRGGRREVRLNAFVEEYVNLACHGMRARLSSLNVEIEQTYDDRIEAVEIVPQEIGQVLINLFNNAFDAMLDRLDQLGEAYQAHMSVSTHWHDSQVEINISDNGQGIPSWVKDKIFDPFFSTKPAGSGTGLGLSLSYDIITQGHGGSLEVESESDKGATFIIKLPV